MGISYLIDTHILLWWLFDDPKLNAQCRDIIRNPDFKIILKLFPPPNQEHEHGKGEFTF